MKLNRVRGVIGKQLLVAVCLLLQGSGRGWAHNRYFCYQNSTSCKSHDDIDCGKAAIRLKSLSARRNWAPCWSCRIGTGCCRYYNYGPRWVDSDKDPWPLLVQNCSKQHACHPSSVLQPSRAIGGIGAVVFRVRYECWNIADMEFDPCVSTNLTFNSYFYLSLQSGINKRPLYERCRCSIVSVGRTTFEVTMIDMRLNSMDTVCENTELTIETSRATKIFNCSSDPVLEMKTVSSQTDDMNISLEMDAQHHPEMIWMLFYVQKSPNTVGVTCDAKHRETGELRDSEHDGLTVSAKVAIPMVIIVLVAMATVAGILVWRRRRHSKVDDRRLRDRDRTGGFQNSDNTREYSLATDVDYVGLYAYADSGDAGPGPVPGLAKPSVISDAYEDCSHSSGHSKSPVGGNVYDHLGKHDNRIATDTYSHVNQDKNAHADAPEVATDNNYSHSEEAEGYSHTVWPVTSRVGNSSNRVPGNEEVDETYNHLHEKEATGSDATEHAEYMYSTLP